MEKNSLLVKRNIGFSPPNITELEIEEVTQALRFGWITIGQEQSS